MGFLSILFGKPDRSVSKAIKEGALLVDVRSPSEFSKGHVKGSVNIPLDQVATQLNKFTDQRSIVVFCESGLRSRRAKAILNRNGFQNVINGKTWRKVKRITNQ